jgi:uncharacterized protein
MKTNSSIILLFFCSFLSPIFSQSYSVEDLPNPKLNNSYLLDLANTIHKDDSIVLDNLLSEIEQKTNTQIAVVILNSIGNEVPKEYAVKLFEKWGIGEKGSDKGLLILFVLDKHRFEFETGYGLEGILPDLVLKKISDTILVPKLKENKITVGVYETLVEIKKILEEESSLSKQDFEIKKKIRLEAAETFAKENESLISDGYEWLVWTIAIVYLILSILLIFYWIGTFVEVAEADLNLQSRKDKLKKQWYKISFWITAIIFAIPMIIVGFILYSMKKDLEEEQIDCPNCKNHTLEKLMRAQAKINKDKAELLEETLENALTTVWKCSNCSFIKKEKKIIKETPNSKCPTCNYYTIKHKFVKVLVPATTTETGSEEWLESCQNCGYTNNLIKNIPKKPINKPSTGRKSKSRSSSHSSSSRSSSRSWGGGRSGGGGYGGSW